MWPLKGNTSSITRECKGSQFVDMRNGTYHSSVIVNSTITLTICFQHDNVTLFIVEDFSTLINKSYPSGYTDGVLHALAGADCNIRYKERGCEHLSNRSWHAPRPFAVADCYLSAMAPQAQWRLQRIRCYSNAVSAPIASPETSGLYVLLMAGILCHSQSICCRAPAYVS